MVIQYSPPHHGSSLALPKALGNSLRVANTPIGLEMPA